MRRLLRILLNAFTVLCLLALLAAAAAWVATRWYSYYIRKPRSVTREEHSYTIVSARYGISAEGLAAWRSITFRPVDHDPPPRPDSAWQWRADKRRPEGDIDWNDPIVKLLYTRWRQWGFEHITFNTPFAPPGSSEGQIASIRFEAWMVPWWPLFLAFTPLPAAKALTPLARRLRRPRPGRCPQCGYDLRATPDRCPECGTIPAR